MESNNLEHQSIILTIKNIWKKSNWTNISQRLRLSNFPHIPMARTRICMLQWSFPFLTDVRKDLGWCSCMQLQVWAASRLHRVGSGLVHPSPFPLLRTPWGSWGQPTSSAPRWTNRPRGVRRKARDKSKRLPGL